MGGTAISPLPFHEIQGYLAPYTCLIYQVSLLRRVVLI